MSCLVSAANPFAHVFRRNNPSAEEDRAAILFLFGPLARELNKMRGKGGKERGESGGKKEIMYWVVGKERENERPVPFLIVIITLS